MIFQVDSNEVKNAYQNFDNFEIQMDESIGSAHKEKRFCAIYFSSNDIYYPNTPAGFNKDIIAKGKYEWFNTRVEYAEKHIFLRDVHKQWYLTGINIKVDTIEKLAEFLKKETEGYSLVMLGSSAGGYGAVLFGQLLGADVILCFNGRFTFSNILKDCKEHECPVLYRQKNNVKVNQYFNLKAHITNPSSVYYFSSLGSAMDRFQYEYIIDTGINIIAFDARHHGIPFLKSSLKNVINLSKNELDHLTLKIHHPLIFSIKSEGFISAMVSLCRQFYVFLWKKVFR